MSLNPFPVTDLRPEVELMHLLRMRKHYCQFVMFKTNGIGQTPSSLERYLVYGDHWRNSTKFTILQTLQHFFLPAF